MELEALIGECTVYDFKVMLEEKKPKSWLKSVSAFANGLGGSLFFGIDNVMAQLDYMEKRGSGLKRICNETKALDGYRDDLKPVFKSTTSQFMTIIYSVKYDAKENENAAKPVERKEQAVIKQSLSNHQVIVKLSLSISNICDLLRKMISPMSAKNMKYFCGQKDSTYFKANVGLNNEYKLTEVSHPMKQPKQSPERALRLQAGVKPLQKRMATLAPKGRQNVLPPLRGLGVHCPDYRGFTPACSLFRPSALGWETSIN